MEDAITCRDGCKRSVEDMKAASAAGWQYLDIQKRWRCPECMRALDEANRMFVVKEPPNE